MTRLFAILIATGSPNDKAHADQKRAVAILEPLYATPGAPGSCPSFGH